MRLSAMHVFGCELLLWRVPCASWSCGLGLAMRMRLARLGAFVVYTVAGDRGGDVCVGGSPAVLLAACCRVIRGGAVWVLDSSFCCSYVVAWLLWGLGCSCLIVVFIVVIPRELCCCCVFISTSPVYRSVSGCAGDYVVDKLRVFVGSFARCWLRRLRNCSDRCSEMCRCLRRLQTTGCVVDG